MSKFKLRRPSPALLVAVIALFVTLGGSAYAAKIITRPAQLDSKVVRNGKVAKENLKGNRFRDDDVKGAQVDESTLGSPLVRKVEVVTVATAENLTNPKTATAPCPSGKKAIGGGGTITGGAGVTEVALESSTVTDDQNGYRARGRALDLEDTPWGVRARAICAEI